MQVMTDMYFRNGQAGIPGHPGKFAPQQHDAATGTLVAPGGISSQRARALSSELEAELNDAQVGQFNAGTNIEDGRESGRAHALAETYARLLFDEDNSFDFSGEGETLLNERHNGDRSSFDLPLDIDGRKRDDVVEYLRDRANQSYVKATSGQEPADVAAFHSGEYEVLEAWAEKVEAA
jgi:hypothetical protein